MPGLTSPLKLPTPICTPPTILSSIVNSSLTSNRNVDTPLTVPRVPLGCSCLEYLKAHKFAELLRVAVPCITWLFKILSEENLPYLAVTMHVSFHYWFTGRA